MFRRPVKEQYMMPVMMSSVVEHRESMASIHVYRNTVVVNIFGAVSVVTLVTVTITVVTTVMSSSSSRDVMGLDFVVNG